MGKLRGFIEYNRKEENVISPTKRIQNYKEFTLALSNEELKKQGGRCMDCGVPFCHSGCPLGNLIPDFNDAVYNDEWKKAFHILQATNNFPEFTGRLCPAPCEDACVLGINQLPVAIELLEKNIVERGFSEGWIKAQVPEKRTGKKVAIIGSGPAGLAAAQQLNQAGHGVTVYERDNKVGGLLRYGIPDFKLEKHIIDRRVNLLEAEGITFVCNTAIGKDITTSALENQFDAIVICTGASSKRPLPIPGANLNGVVQAMDFLSHNNKVVDGQLNRAAKYQANNKNVIVIGGGDTGSDCIGTSMRHGAKSLTNFELMPKPAATRTVENPWPFWSFKLSNSSSHKEGGQRAWNIMTKEFLGDENGNLIGLVTVEVDWQKVGDNKSELVEVQGSEKTWPCELALLALGFTGTEKSLPEQFGLAIDAAGNILTTKKYQSKKTNIFTAGDARRGQSLIVWAISEGREAAHQVDTYLMGKSLLPQKNEGGDLLSA